MKTKPFFSIIIPVYNTEQYIQRCLVSCIEQTFKDIEIIVVDDCGQDDAINIAQKYAKNDSRIQIVRNSKNRGLFFTRIAGEKIAQGEYIICLDSDDFISTQMCQILYQTIQSHNNEGGGVLDIIGFTSEITPKPSKGNCLINSPLGVYQQPELMDTVIFHWMIWNKVYHRNIVAQTIHFLDTHFQSIPKINMAEDALKFFILCLFSKNYYGINDILHFYFKNEKSITRDLNNLRRHKSAIQGFSQTISMLRKIQDLHPLAYQKASVIIEILSNHKRETLYSFWTTRARSAKNYIGNLNRAIKITRSPKKKIIAYRKICLYLVSFRFFKS